MNVSMELANKDMLKNQVIKELDSLTQDQLEKLLIQLIDWRNDKRSHAREAKSFMDVTYWDDTEQHDGYIRNLSSGGSFINSAGAFSLGQHITLKFYHPIVDGPIEIEGEIVRREKRGIGVKFSNKIKELAKGR
ncbi:MAG: PilZ domain-containing protein [Deltaproteobacteria bacterium]|nr:PilZ domain-containing protein [Deltaproteobacteria bacterium]